MGISGLLANRIEVLKQDSNMIPLQIVMQSCLMNTCAAINDLVVMHDLRLIRSKV